MIVGFLRATKFAIQNFWRNLWLSVITVFLLVLTTSSITVVVGLNVVGQHVIDAVQDKVNIDIYFYDTTPEKTLLKAQEYLKGMSEVSDVIYVSQEEALKDFREAHKNDPEILATLDELERNILPPSLTVRAHDIDDYPKISNRFEGSEFAQYVDHQDFSDNKALIDKISQITRRSYELGIGVSVIFIIISVIVIFNTIRITIYSHRGEVGIMKLVGATNGFIRAPFILESVILGFLAALVTTSIFYGLLVVSNHSLSTFFNGYQFSPLSYFASNFLIVIFVECVGAVLLSCVSSMIAITRYLKD